MRQFIAFTLTMFVAISYAVPTVTTAGREDCSDYCITTLQNYKKACASPDAMHNQNCIPDVRCHPIWTRQDYSSGICDCQCMAPPPQSEIKP